MENTSNQLCFPAIGGKSPLLNFSARYLKRAYYLTNAFIFFVIFAVFGYIKYQEWQYERRLKQLGKDMGKKVISVTYAQLGPPPSIMGQEGATPQTVTGRPAAPTVGVPKPVPDALAQQETSLEQSEISGQSPLTGTGTGEGTAVVVEEIPDINAFIPHEVEPKFLFKPRLEYPDAARTFEYEGTVFIKAFLDATADIKKIVVVQSSGYPILDSAAVNYIAQCKFTPAEQNKKPIGVWIGQTVTFKLK